MYYPIHQYVGQTASSSQPSDPLAGVPADEAFTAGVVLASRAAAGMFLGGLILYALNPSLGIPRWALALIGGVGGLALGTYAGFQGAVQAMPSLKTQPNMQGWMDLATPTPTPMPNVGPIVPSSSSPSTIDT